jgi:archaellum component FlaF (FlaF/FlaG flagellin family)
MRKDRGVTLIETIIYLALFAIVIVGLMISGYGLLENVGRNQSESMLQEGSSFLIAKIDWALAGAESVSSPAANSSGQTVRIRKYDGTDITITRSGTSILFNGIAINDTDTMIRDLVFIHAYSGSGGLESVEAGLTLTMLTPNGARISVTASTTRYIRK